VVKAWGVAASFAMAGDGEIAGVVDSVGLHTAATALVTEWVDRCVPPCLPRDLVVRLELTHRGRTADRVLTFAAGQVTVTADTGAVVCIRCEITDLARLLFGSRHRRDTAPWSHELLLTREATPECAATRRAAVLATRALIAGARDDASLTDLAVHFGSDKWGELHWYTPHYERHFAHLRDEPVRLLEIGIGGYADAMAGGGSLLMWQRYFRRGLICGLDLAEKKVTGSRIRTVQGDQNDPGFLADLARRTGPLDIVIDDGSHVNEHVLTSFRTLFPLLRAGGIYVIEDLQSSYWPSYGGDNADLNSPATSVGHLKSLVDGLNHREYHSGPPSYFDHHVVGLHFYHNLAFVTKGVNDECGPVRIPT
jgi:MycE methyltransferase N-terminal